MGVTLGEISDALRDEWGTWDRCYRLPLGFNVLTLHIKHAPSAAVALHEADAHLRLPVQEGMHLRSSKRCRTTLLPFVQNVARQLRG